MHADYYHSDTTMTTAIITLKTAIAITISYTTVNREYFVVKIFSDSLACAKIKRAKIHAQY